MNGKVNCEIGVSLIEDDSMSSDSISKFSVSICPEDSLEEAVGYCIGETLLKSFHNLSLKWEICLCYALTAVWDYGEGTEMINKKDEEMFNNIEAVAENVRRIIEIAESKKSDKENKK